MHDEIAPPAVNLLIPDWPAPASVRALVTLRPLDGSVQGPARVSQMLMSAGLIAAQPFWLHQVHGAIAYDADDVVVKQAPLADAAATGRTGAPLVVQTADCLPVLFADVSGSVVGAAHAGWRGLAAGVLESTVRLMRDKSPNANLIAWFGPAIGPQQFEVGAEVRAAFLSVSAQAAEAFTALGADDQGHQKYLCNLYALARQRLSALGLTQVYGGGLCTVSDAGRFYSFRRDKRVVDHLRSMIWLV
jgi:polyphenol oxidase